MLRDKTGFSQETNPIKTRGEADETLVKQINYLQKVLGNKEVENLIERGIINKTVPLNATERIIKSVKRKEEYEEEQIKADREAMMGEIAEILAKKKEKADTLLKSAQGGAVYVNVSTELVYAELPGETTSLFYHYTDLVNVDLSYQNVNRKDPSMNIKRGKKIPLIFSFKYQPVEEEIKTPEEEKLEEQPEFEEKPRKSKLSKEGKTEKTTPIEKETPKTTFFKNKKG
jgi:hypothetical protein